MSFQLYIDNGMLQGPLLQHALLLAVVMIRL
jgi:hypothetical protein